MNTTPNNNNPMYQQDTPIYVVEAILTHICPPHDISEVVYAGTDKEAAYKATQTDRHMNDLFRLTVWVNGQKQNSKLRSMRKCLIEDGATLWEA